MTCGPDLFFLFLIALALLFAGVLVGNLLWIGLAAFILIMFWMFL